MKEAANINIVLPISIMYIKCNAPDRSTDGLRHREVLIGNIEKVCNLYTSIIAS